MTNRDENTYVCFMLFHTDQAARPNKTLWTFVLCAKFVADPAKHDAVLVNSLFGPRGELLRGENHRWQRFPFHRCWNYQWRFVRHGFRRHQRLGRESLRGRVGESRDEGQVLVCGRSLWSLSGQRVVRPDTGDPVVADQRVMRRRRRNRMKGPLQMSGIPQRNRGGCCAGWNCFYSRPLPP